MLPLQKLALVSLAALLPSSHGLVSQSLGRRCRCRPQDPCWPSHHEWQALNSSIDGFLASVLPVAHACHGAAFDADACKALSAKSTNSTWRASKPGAVQWTNWEAWPERNESCFFDSPASTPCRQGRVSLFSAVVEKTEHIQAAVRFAAAHDLRLVIKNSGHCFVGRSTAPESLQISTGKLKSISFTDRFTAAGAPHGQQDQGPAVTIGAGVNLKELYSAAARRNLTLVAGFAHTVGVAGGYILGGGHSPLGNWKGMGSDNALEFTLVNAKGDVVVANDHQNQDLFWALRGGGGGTFGVVVSVTVRTFPSEAAVVIELGFAIAKGSLSAFWELTKRLHLHLPAISDAGGSGYYYAIPKPQRRNGTEVLTLSAMFLFLNDTQTDKAREVLDPLAADLRSRALPDSVYSVARVPQISGWIDTALKGGADTTGGTAWLGSRMVSRDFLVRPDGPERLQDAMRFINDTMGGVGFSGHVVAGGAVARSSVDSALNPAWRRTLTHVILSVDWNSSTPAAEQRVVQDKMTKVAVERLRALEPEMGAYLNEADAHERDFQRSFWGANYERLYAIKKAQDPAGLFIARKGVGSEDWDDAGLCRIGGGRKLTPEQGQGLQFDSVELQAAQ